MTPELQSKIALWRQRAVAGTLTEADMIEAVLALREGRKSAAVASETKRKSTAKANAPAPSGNDLLDEMLGG